jgi:hypothetical protein
MSAAVMILAIPSCFPAAIRTTGLAIAYALGVTLFGGTAQFVFTWLIGSPPSPLAPVWYVIVANLVSIAAVLALPLRRGVQGRRTA